jgi:hypothetical protein
MKKPLNVKINAAMKKRRRGLWINLPVNKFDASI